MAQVAPGTGLTALATDGNWTQVELTGWVWLPSLGASEDPAFDLVISAEGGENLRDGPSGRVIGRLEQGALLSEAGRDPSWAQVSRVGWIWSASLAGEDEASAPGGAAPTGAAPTAASETPVAPAARVPGGFTNVVSGGPILSAPDGDTLAVAVPQSDVEVVRREGSWVRVRVEGWMWMPVGQAEAAQPIEEAPVALEPDELKLDPELHVGRVVAWTLQFISLERAEAVRTDFFEGEPFLLSRFGAGDGPFVYVAVPTDRVGDVDGLVPLERIAVTGRIRTGASALTGAPIIDLVSIERVRED